jgi:hypothetical protein
MLFREGDAMSDNEEEQLTIYLSEQEQRHIIAVADGAWNSEGPPHDEQAFLRVTRAILQDKKSVEFFAKAAAVSHSHVCCDRMARNDPNLKHVDEDEDEDEDADD